MKVKRRMKILSMALTATLGIVSLAACGSGDDASLAEQSKNILTTSVINDFSEMKDLYQMVYSGALGIVNLNTDTTYIKTGKGSAKLDIRAKGTSNSMPTMKQRLSSATQGYNFNDLSKAKRVKLQMYSAASEDVFMYISLEFKGTRKCSRTAYRLSSGWNELVYEIDRASLMSQFALDEAAYIVCEFEAQEQPFTVYLDSVSITETEKPVETLKKSLETDEICSFDKNWQASIFNVEADVASKLGLMTEYGLTGKPEFTRSGSAFYMKLIKGDTRWGNWTYMHLGEDNCKLVDFESITVNDTIEWWVYCEGTAMNGCNVWISCPNGQLATGGSISEPLTANGWTCFTIKVSDMQKKAEENGWVEDGQSVGEIVNNMTFTWGEFVDTDERTLYFDDVRIVRGGKAE